MQNPKRECNFATRSCPHGHYCSLALGQFLSSAKAAAGHSDPLCHVWSIRSSRAAAGSPPRARARGGLRAGQEERCKQTENSGEPLALVRLGLLIRLSHTACSGQQQETSLPSQAWERIMQKNSELIEECQPPLCFQIIQLVLLSRGCPSPIVTLVCLIYDTVSE